MHRHLCAALGAAAVVAALGLSGCSHRESKISSSAAPSAAPVVTTPIAAPPAAPLPAPEALTDVLNRLADPAVPGINKLNLIEGATPESAATLDEFTTALRDGGYLPMTFVANNIAWSDKNPSNAVATISVNTGQANNRAFTFPMEFAPFQGGWQLSRRTAEMLLALGNSPAPAPESTPAPASPPESTPPG